MKKLFVLLFVCSMGLTTIGCGDTATKKDETKTKTETTKTDTTKTTPATTPAAK